MVDKASKAIGIDLGTTYCCCGYLTEDGKVKIIPSESGHQTTPSYVAFNDHVRLVGNPAK